MESASSRYSAHTCSTKRAARQAQKSTQGAPLAAADARRKLMDELITSETEKYTKRQTLWTAAMQKTASMKIGLRLFDPHLWIMLSQPVSPSFQMERDIEYWFKSPLAEIYGHARHQIHRPPTTQQSTINKVALLKIAKDVVRGKFKEDRAREIILKSACGLGVSKIDLNNCFDWAMRTARKEGGRRNGH